MQAVTQKVCYLGVQPVGAPLIYEHLNSDYSVITSKEIMILLEKKLCSHQEPIYQCAYIFLLTI